MIRRAPLIALAIAVAMSTPPAHARSRTLTEDYVGSSQLTLPGTCRDATVPVNIGKACFKPHKGERRATITVTDAVETNVGIFYIVSDKQGNCIGDNPDPASTDPCPNSGLACQALTIPIPRKSALLEVWIDGITAPVECLVAGPGESPGIGTAGTIKVRFRG
jgi:hypothetical protein